MNREGCRRSTLSPPPCGEGGLGRRPSRIGGAGVERPCRKKSSLQAGSNEAISPIAGVNRVSRRTVLSPAALLDADAPHPARPSAESALPTRGRELRRPKTSLQRDRTLL